MAQKKGFIQSFFDFSFSSFVAVKIAGVLYAINIVGAGLFAFSVIISRFFQGFFYGIGALIVVPLLYLMYIVFIRLSLESMVVLFRIAENTARTAENTKYLKNEKLLK
ncbi:MAG: hypothetical protein BRC57_00555 [Cyanobacteria bacterium QS_8_48_54]|jgi:hypothetical protein|nr:MAG: hypothetical protein BRC57_00555 [Cyanobacteria bacterium QS_8_48_54]